MDSEYSPLYIYGTEKALVQNLVICRIDYRDSIFFSLPNALLVRSERILKVSGRLIFKQTPSTSTHLLMKSLHLLKLKYRIRYKVILMTWKYVNNQAPKYLAVLVPYKPSRLLGSSENHELVVPRTRIRYGTFIASEI